MIMGARLAFWISGFLLMVSALAAAKWWTLVSVNIPPDWRVWLFLIGLACFQVASLALLVRLLLREKRNLSRLIGVVLLSLGSVCSNLLNGFFSPVAGGLLGVFVLLITLVMLDPPRHGPRGRNIGWNEASR